MRTVEEVLEALVEHEIANVRKPDEFDAHDYMRTLEKRGVRITYDTAYRRLRRKEGKGLLTSRVIYGEKNGVSRVFRVVKKLAIDPSLKKGYNDH